MDRCNGILPVRKETGMTSHDLVQITRGILKQQKVGHTGTLDPEASGLMILTLGRATKLTQFFTEWDKSYLAELTLGEVSDTLDSAGERRPGKEVPDLTKLEIDAFIQSFVGTITQKVPVYSAVKVGGRELHKYARQGIEIERPDREVQISTIEITTVALPRLTIRVSCSKGTYIRVLADDIGRAIGCGAYLSALERTMVGPYSVDQALSLDNLRRRQANDTLDVDLIPVEKAVSFPTISIGRRVTDQIQNGLIPVYHDIIAMIGEFHPGDLVSMANDRGEILAIGRAKYDAAYLRAHKADDFFSYVRVLV